MSEALIASIVTLIATTLTTLIVNFYTFKNSKLQLKEHIEEKKDLYIEIILDIENKVKKLEENYNIEDVEKVKANLDFWTRFIRIWKLKKEHNYGKEDDEVLEIFDERLKKLEEKIKTLESKYQ